MKQYLKGCLLLLGLLSFLFVMGCGDSGGGSSGTTDTGTVQTGQTEKNDEDNTSTGTRDNTPIVKAPSADGTVTYGNDLVSIDASHTDQGYVMVKYTGSNDKVKMQLIDSTGYAYTYLLSQDQIYEVFPFSSGNGTYSIHIYEHVMDSKYAEVFSQDLEVTLEDEYLPFLYPNQYVNFDSDSQAVTQAQSLAEGASCDLDVVSSVYDYVVDNITYDYDKASSVEYGYLPDVDETLETKTGICFDYASLMSAMLRSQGIPTKLEIGYVGEVYHAWISTYVDDVGWVDNVIEFDGDSWKIMDPTFASTEGGHKDVVEDGSSYDIKYYY